MEHVASLTVATSGAVGVDVDRLIALLPHAEPTGARHIGAADVAAIEQATAEFARQDFATGSGPIQALAVTRLHYVLPLLATQTADELWPRLYLATARLATQAGWMSFEVNHFPRTSE